MNLIESFKNKAKQLSDSGATYLLTVSGGMDSMVMIHLFHELKLNCSVAHCNFKLRGADSDADEELVRKTASSFGFPFYTKSFQTELYSQEKKISIQMAARDLRYEWFESLLKENQIHHLVTAHHANDQSETMLLNFAKGKSIFSISGIPLTNKNIIRPLLSFTKEELHQYAKQHAVEWREDVSNASVDYERNFIRHTIIPSLKEINPSLDQSLQQSSESLKEISEYILIQFQQWKEKSCLATDNNLALNNIESLTTSSLPKNFLFLLLQPYGFTAPVIRQISENLQAESGTTYFSPTHQLTFNRNSILINPLRESDEQIVVIPKPGLTQTPDIQLRIEEVKEADFSLGQQVAFLDAAKVQFPLELRHWLPGDHFIPLGMSQSKKLSDFFIDNKVPLPDKNRVWLLLSEGEIAWIAGYRISQRFALSDTTKTILKITFAVP